MQRTRLGSPLSLDIVGRRDRRHMSRLTSEEPLTVAEETEEDIRQACRPLFVLTFGCLYIFIGDLAGFGRAGFVLALALIALLHFKQSRIAALLISLVWSAVLVVFVESHAGLPTWPERIQALLCTVGIVSGGLAVRATFRYHRAIHSSSSPR